ncbi:MAG: N-acetyltransferase family protein, partial [Gaiellaceae bacterium]
TVRIATVADLAVLEALWRAFEAEVPPPAHVDVDEAQELAEIGEIVRSGLAWLAERHGDVLGMALARRRSPRLARLTDLYVRPEARGHGVAEALVREVVARFVAEGAEAIDLEVLASNGAARAVYGRWGFREDTLTLVAPLDALAARLGEAHEASSFGSIHVQTDDVDAIVRALEIYVPRLPGGSRGSIVSPPRDGYVAVYDDVCDRDPAMLRRLAKEISTRTGLVALALGVEEEAVVRLILFDRGAIVDEYASVPEHQRPLPPGEVVALQANPVVIERLTGADQGAVRAATPTGRSLSELPPPRELLAGLAGALGVTGAGHGFADAPELAGSIRLER